MSVQSCSLWQTTTSEPGFSARQPILQTPLLSLAPLSAVFIFQALRLPRWQRQHRDASHHTPNQPLRQMAFRQQKPVVAGMLYQPSTCLHQPLLQAGQRPRFDSLRQHQPPPQVAQVVGENAEPQPNFVAPKHHASERRIQTLLSVRCIRCGWSKYGFQLTGTPRGSGASPVTYVLRAAQSPTTHQRSLSWVKVVSRPFG